MKKIIATFFMMVCVFSGLAVEYQFVDFEPPHYVVGTPLASPWVISGGTAVSITSSPIFGFGSQSLSVMGEGGARYEMLSPQGDTFTFSVVVKLPNYSPGSYQGGFVSFGGIQMPNEAQWYVGGVYFELQKPYSSSTQPGHRQIWFKQAYNVVGYFIDGGTYTITYNINWVTKTSVVHIVGSGNIDITLTNQDNMITKTDFCGFSLRGSSSWIGNPAFFDNMIIGEPPQAVVGDFDNNGSVDLYDYAAIAYSWNSSPADENWNAECNLNNTGGSENVIDFADLLIFLNNWLPSI